MFENINGEMVSGFIRHTLTTFGGIFMAWGGFTTDEWTAIVGAIATLVGVGWSLLSKKTAE